MNAFEFAKKMEIDGIKLYEEVLGKTTNEGLKNILKMLISQEKKHYELFEFMQNSTDTEMDKASFKGIKNLFEKMKGEEFPAQQNEVYERILKVEHDSEEFYKGMAEKQEDDKVKQQILQIADEEHRHYLIVNNILEMVNRPDTWLDSAEINHLEEY